ncbi:MAG: DUF1501 domain-containing protein [Gammaproteobacteria bacterium]|nr:DUF1501 domain-containing protein [Gammaproteobacteria bacterium]
MNRRDFLKLTLYSTAATTLGNPFMQALAAHGSPHRTLVNVMCLGGADFRYMFAPPPSDTEYANKYWQARQPLYSGYADYNSAFGSLYTAHNAGDLSFGIHNNAGWLKTQYEAGNVAIICNVAGSTNRRHDQSQLIVNSGDLNANQFVYDRDGWGGRLAEAIGEANTVAMTHDVSVFCKGTQAANRNAQVIHVRDSRSFALSHGGNPNQEKVARALKNYYASRSQTIQDKPDNWPYHKFFQHEQKLRAFGDPFKALIEQPENTLPIDIVKLNDPGSMGVLNQRGFAKQCANVYDSLTGADLFKLRVASMEYGGWDTHRNQKNQFENNISDIFGTLRGLDMLTSNLAPEVWNNLVFVFTTDFGRQLKANGDSGTDHGSGNYMILVGPAVNGGVYGEISAAGGPAPYDVQGADILGRTSFERVLAKACDWVEPSSGVQVFPNMAYSDLAQFPDGPILEDGVDLSTLLS